MESYGEILRQAREEKNLELDRIARETSDSVLYLMRKPSFRLFEEFKRIFDKINREKGLKQQKTAFNPIEDRKNVSKPNKNTASCGLKEGKGKQRQIVTKEYGKRTNIWRINQQQCSDHPAPFPYILARDHIVSWSNENDIILDPFIGSGTTAIAAIKEKRNFIGFELNKEYYDKACKRIQLEMAQPSLF